MIAARLDELPPEQRAVLADAAVLGQVAWVGAIAAVGGEDPNNLDTWLHLNRYLAELERRELLGRTAGSRIAGEVEVAFRHVLVRDVAYAQLPRAARAERHQRAAAWLDQLAPDRASDRAELLAHHYTQALTFARAGGSPTVELVDRARLALRAAGDHAMALGTEALAARHYTEALALWPAGDHERPELEFRAGEARCLGESTGEDLLIQARDGLLAQGNRERAAEAEARLGQLAYHHGYDRSPYMERALTLVADAPASHSKAAVLQGCIMDLLAADRYAEALTVARETLAMARTLGDNEVATAALGAIGAARVNLGDPGGLADLERCIAIYQEHGSPASIDWQNNLAFSLAILGDLHRCFLVRHAALDAAQRYGSTRTLHWLELERAGEHYWNGHWDQATAIAESLTVEASGRATHYLEGNCRIWYGRILLARGQLRDARNESQRALDLARTSNERQNLNPALGFRARVLLATGDAAQAGQLIDELLERLPGAPLMPDLGIDLPLCLVELGHPLEALQAIPGSRWLEAARAFVNGHKRQAADIYAAIGSRPDEAYARLEAARQLMTADQTVEASTKLALALAFYRQVRASAHLADAEKLLATMLSSD